MASVHGWCMGGAWCMGFGVGINDVVYYLEVGIVGLVMLDMRFGVGSGFGVW